MFYCDHCQKIISTRLNNQFSFLDKYNHTHLICDCCVDKINSALQVQVDLNKLALLKEKIRMNLTVNYRHKQQCLSIK